MMEQAVEGGRGDDQITEDVVPPGEGDRSSLVATSARDLNGRRSIATFLLDVSGHPYAANPGQPDGVAERGGASRIAKNMRAYRLLEI
jgi:hypothetical protein